MSEAALAPLYVLDELELRAGVLAAFRDALASDYQPSAALRGMELLHTWVTPPLELREGGTRVLLVWRIAGVAGFWRMRGQADPGLDAWWRRCESSFTTSRTRRFAADADALAGFEQAARTHA